jgi:hypothetical protein
MRVRSFLAVGSALLRLVCALQGPRRLVAADPRRRPHRHSRRRWSCRHRGDRCGCRTEHSTAPDAGEIGVLSSRDGGLTWSSSTLPGVSAFAWEPVIAVDQHGTVGVIWHRGAARPKQVQRIPRVGRTTQGLRRRLWPRGAAGAGWPDRHLLRANRAGRRGRAGRPSLMVL